MGAMKRMFLDDVEPFLDGSLPAEILVNRFNLAEAVEAAMARRGVAVTPTALSRLSGISEGEAKAIIHRWLDHLQERRLLEILGAIA